MAKRYYYLKFRENFFEDEKILYLESLENGDKYIIFWQKLLLKCLRGDSANNGILKFTQTIPYTDKLLANVTHTDIDIVRSAIKIFLELEMIRILDDGTIFIEAIGDFLGSESESLERVRKFRSKLVKMKNEENQLDSNLTPLHGNAKALQKRYNGNVKCNGMYNNKYNISNINKYNITNIPNCNANALPCNAKKSNNLNQIDYEFIVNAYHNHLSQLPKIQMVTDTRRRKMKSLSFFMKCTDQSYTPWIDYFKKVAKSKFLIGLSNQPRSFKANFDWLLNQTNYVKVMEGNYEK